MVFEGFERRMSFQTCALSLSCEGVALDTWRVDDCLCDSRTAIDVYQLAPPPRGSRIRPRARKICLLRHKISYRGLSDGAGRGEKKRHHGEEHTVLPPFHQPIAALPAGNDNLIIARGITRVHVFGRREMTPIVHRTNSVLLFCALFFPH